MNFLQVAPSGSMIGAIVAISFFLLFAGTAYIAFKALKKTAKMAVRMMVVVIILAIAVIGSTALWYFSTDSTPKLKPPANKRR